MIHPTFLGVRAFVVFGVLSSLLVVSLRVVSGFENSQSVLAESSFPCQLVSFRGRESTVASENGYVLGSVLSSLILLFVFGFLYVLAPPFAFGAWGWPVERPVFDEEDNDQNIGVGMCCVALGSGLSVDRPPRVVGRVSSDPLSFHCETEYIWTYLFIYLFIYLLMYLSCFKGVRTRGPLRQTSVAP